MKQIINWKGLDKISSNENCRVEKTDSGYIASSNVTGILDDISYHCEYEIMTDNQWKTIGFQLTIRVGWKELVLEIQKSHGKWIGENGELSDFDDCHDIDISVTPFTNTLPINRLSLEIGQPQTIKVIYIDVLKQEVYPIEQIYTKISKHTYRYENTTNDFKAEITVDDNGFVIDYPNLFGRI
ncbi:putative glycolipid-binding domain-containing protein [Flavobacterium sp. 3HN19-14]|uniref:putative glycolipid-binding domain-containing protein n=1 Tax=Flavobacterium sp. 3HN19-14 TaxID=3448133 RepID=UPI003EDE82A1